MWIIEMILFVAFFSLVTIFICFYQHDTDLILSKDRTSNAENLLSHLYINSINYDKSQRQ